MVFEDLKDSDIVFGSVEAGDKHLHNTICTTTPFKHDVTKAFIGLKCGYKRT